MKRPWITVWLLFSASFIHWLNLKANFTHYELTDQNDEMKMEPEMNFGDIWRNFIKHHQLEILNAFGFLNMLILLIYRFSIVRTIVLKYDKIIYTNFRNDQNVKFQFLLLGDFERNNANPQNHYFV